MQSEPQKITVQEITAQQLKMLLDSTEPPFVLDVREAFELPQQGVIPNSTHIPMGTVPGRLSELPRDRAIVTQCSHGYRSYDVAGYLTIHGFKDVKSLSGGIVAWNRLLRSAK